MAERVTTIELINELLTGIWHNIENDYIWYFSISRDGAECICFIKQNLLKSAPVKFNYSITEERDGNFYLQLDGIKYTIVAIDIRHLVLESNQVSITLVKDIFEKFLLMYRR